jgi:hypothetical protein
MRNALPDFALLPKQFQHHQDCSAVGFCQDISGSNNNSKHRPSLATEHPIKGSMGYSRVWQQRDDELDGRVNGWKAVSSAQITGDIVLLGKFSEMIIANWLGIELNVNAHSRAINAETVILATLLVDVEFRYPLAFTASTDAGSQ